jgi:hypothetical protein
MYVRNVAHTQMLDYTENYVLVCSVMFICTGWDNIPSILLPRRASLQKQPEDAPMTCGVEAAAGQVESGGSSRPPRGSGEGRRESQAAEGPHPLRGSGRRQGARNGEDGWGGRTRRRRSGFGFQILGTKTEKNRVPRGFYVKRTYNRYSGS